MPRKLRAHGALPANWKYRDGRPRWEPGPGLRQAGWRGLDLKDRAGAWLSEGASIDAARSVNAAVAAWRAGQLAPETWAHVAPVGATVTPAMTRQEKIDQRSIGALMDRYKASREFRGLGVQSQRFYRSKLSRLLDVLAGWPHPPRAAEPEARRKAHAAAVAAVRGMSVDVLEPPEFGAPGEPLLKTAYWTMHDQVGHHMAVGTLRVTSAWLDWAMVEERSVRLNAAKLVKMKEPKGRIRVGSWGELAALVAAAEKLGFPSIGDSVILGVDLSWSQQDRLALTWPQISAEHRVRGVRRKTARPGETRLLPSLGVPRIQAIKARQLAAGAQHTHVLVCETTGAAWTDSHYRTHFAEVRVEAARSCPSVATLRDQDLRDTAVTVAYEAGLTIPEICSRTLHSPVQAQRIIDAHYGQITRTVGDNAADKLETYMAKVGVKL